MLNKNKSFYVTITPVIMQQKTNTCGKKAKKNTVEVFFPAVKENAMLL